jgi:branched-chain amino acid transport system permease protein
MSAERVRQRTRGAIQVVETGIERIQDALRQLVPPETVDRFLTWCGDNDWRLLAGMTLVFGIVGAALPTGFYMTVVMDMFLFGVLALSWDLVGGQTGYPSFGNMAFFGIGAYTTAILTKKVGVTFPVAFVVAGLLALAFAAVIGTIVLRLRGHYFAIATLGVLLATQQISRIVDVTGGASGIILLDTPGQRDFYFLLLGLLVVEMAAVHYLSSTRFGFVLNAIRDDEGKATAMGFNTTYYKTTAWMLAALFTGLAGAVWSLENGFLEPQSAYNGAWNVELIVMALMGGAGTVAGPVLGAFGLHLLIVVVDTVAAGWQLVLLGLAVIVTVGTFPDGLVGTLSEYAGDLDYFEQGGMAAVDAEAPEAEADAEPGDADGDADADGAAGDADGDDADPGSDTAEEDGEVDSDE